MNMNNILAGFLMDLPQWYYNVAWQEVYKRASKSICSYQTTSLKSLKFPIHTSFVSISASNQGWE